MNKKPTVGEALSEARKKVAALAAGKLALKNQGEAPRLQLQKRNADFEAHVKKMKRAIAAPAIEAEKRRVKEHSQRVEETTRRIKEDEAMKAPLARIQREHEAQIAGPKKEHEAAQAAIDRAKREHEAQMARMRPRR
jgi:hypothetical protein